jgi:hypothetical protein
MAVIPSAEWPWRLYQAVIPRSLLLLTLYIEIALGCAVFFQLFRVRFPAEMRVSRRISI